MLFLFNNKGYLPAEMLPIFLQIQLKVQYFWLLPVISYNWRKIAPVLRKVIWGEPGIVFKDILFENNTLAVTNYIERYQKIATEIYGGYFLALNHTNQKIAVMLYMIIERFHPDKVKTLYNRFDEKSRMLPNGVTYINSWIDEQVATCYQVMESDTVEKINDWITYWNDLADFEVIPVLTSAQAKEKVFAS